MAINYSNAVKNTRLTAVITALGSGSKLVIGTSALNGATGVLVEVTLANPPFTVGTATMDLADLPRTATATATGTAAKAELRTSAGVVVATGLTVGSSGADIIVNATAISTGQTIQVTAGTINHG